MDESDEETQIAIVQIVTAPATTTAGETSQMRGSSYLPENPKSLEKCQSCKRCDGVHWRQGLLTSGLPPWPTTHCKWLRDVLGKEGGQGNEAERQVRWQINGINSLSVLEKMGKKPQPTWSRLRLSTLIPISPLYNKEKMKIPWRNKRKDFMRKVCDIQNICQILLWPEREPTRARCLPPSLLMEFNPQDPHCGREELIHRRYPMTSTHMPLDAHAYTCTCTHTQ